jgi:uncharacterized RDD family membrane protein YckC
MNNQDLLDGKTKYETSFDNDYASFGDRLIAAIIDGIIMTIPRFVFALFLPDTASKIAAFLLGWLYSAIMISGPSQATVGKQMMNIFVTDSRGNQIDFAKASVRYFATIISALIMLIGYFIQPFTDKKQALHDIIADTVVLKRKWS